MVLRSGKIYYSALMSFDPTVIDQILQQLTTLNTKLDDIKNCVTTLEETGRVVNGTMTPNATPARTVHKALADGNQTHPFRFNFQPVDDITKNVRIEAPTFGSRFDPKTFINWLTSIDQFFDWYIMSDDRCVHFAKMKLIGAAKQYWVSFER